jgi:cation diffusion facilitator family transporter
VGINIATKKPTERFPYGYYKAETFALLMVSFILIASSVLIMLESFQRFFVPRVVSFSDVALFVAALSMVVYYLLAKYKSRVGRSVGSQALISEGVHSMIDVYTSALVFAGVFLGAVGYPAGEALIGLVIGGYVLVRGLLFGKDAALVLMDVSPSPSMVKEMREIAESVSGVKGTHDIRLRKSGPVFFGDMHVELQEGLSLERAHAISEKVETELKEHFKDLELVTVHAGVSHKKKRKIAIPIVEDKGLDSLTSPHFGIAPYFAFIDLEEDQVVGFYAKENEGARLLHKKGIQAADLLVTEKVDVALVAGLGEGPFHILGDNLIQIYKLPKSMKIVEALDLFSKSLLEKMASPTEEHEEQKIE